ncbi:NOF-FB transposable element protein [Aphis craccivora]|uniref:NOF-FB transposable element protein n=1 Tax=Aphis craccivora TaxID=307492 RepID=A0A6G0XZP7_APHCR|nr:NOF-FB transposable element protein [Aphis craccivora]
MNALCIGWNGFTSIFDYRNWCCGVFVENHDGSNVTIINICVNHYTKIIVNHVYTYFQSETGNSKDLKYFH